MMYETSVSIKGFVLQSETSEALIDLFQGVADELKKMRDAGITLDPDTTSENWASLVTEDPKVAEEFGLEPVPEVTEEEEEQQWLRWQEEELRLVNRFWKNNPLNQCVVANSEQSDSE
jgi:hypothetical protein